MMAMNNYFLFPHQPPLDWDPQPFGLGDFHEQNLTLAMESQMPLEETSTGYLQDVLAGWSSTGGGRSKRRRLGAFPSHNSANIAQEFWNSEFFGSNLANSSHQLQENIRISDQDPFSLLFVNSETQTPAAPDLLQEQPAFNSSLSIEPYSNESLDQARATSKELTSKDCEEKRLELKKKDEKKRKKKKVIGLVYPFAVVKPGGVEGDVTLADINARILMRPRRPVRHPVGEYAGGPCVADGGLGLSGKAVVSLARIHTRGSGTITIIRTRG